MDSSLGDGYANGGRPLSIPARGRPQLSCTPCKQRKLKCDRTKPCDNCTKRRDADACSYPAAGSAGRDQARSSKKTKKRLERLESLVMELLDKGPPQNTSLPGQPRSNGDQIHPQKQVEFSIPIDIEGRPAHPGAAVPRPARPSTSSSSSALWEGVLQDIGEIKSYFEEHEDDFEQQARKVDHAINPPAEPHMLQGSPDQWDLDTALPPREAVDTLVASYFAADSPVRPIIHPRKFLREYEKFWEDPQGASKLWVGLLFAIMRHGIRIAKASGIDLRPSLGDVEESISLFRLRTKQILLTSSHEKPSMPLLELLCVHLDAEFMTSFDSNANIWIDLAVAIRMAMKSGLHRDPGLYGHFTPFECEMRRRLWLTLVITDLLVSWQVGMPAMIPRGQHDTLLPRNLRDDDFDEDSVSLPLSRPFTESTKVSHYIVKAPLLNIFAKAASLMLDIHPNEAEIPVLEDELLSARDALPPAYKVHSLQESLLDSPSVILRRFAIDQLVQSGLCVLHRRHLPLARTNPYYSHSRKVCVDAALTLLDYQAIYHRETGPTGRLAGHNWVSTSVTRHDYLLAAMLICLDLRLAMSVTTHPASMDIPLWGKDKREEMVTALETSYHVWRDSKDTSIEAFRASEAVGVLLNKIAECQTNKQYDSFAAIPSVPSVEGLDISQSQFATEETDPYSLTLPFFEMVASPGEINWVDFDRFVRGSEMQSGTAS